MKLLLSICLLIACGVAQAAKVPGSLVTPTQNTDGSALTDLASVRVEWGSCTSSNGFGAVQSGIVITTTAVGATINFFIYPTGLTKVCLRAYATNAAGVSSDPSNTAWKNLLPTTGKPVTLGQPVVLP